MERDLADRKAAGMSVIGGRYLSRSARSSTSEDFATQLHFHLTELLALPGRIVDARTIKEWAAHLTTPLPTWVVPFRGNTTQDPHQRAGVARAVTGVICETDNIGHVLEASETLGETSAISKPSRNSDCTTRHSSPT